MHSEIKRSESVAVVSRSFSKNPVLKKELLSSFPNAIFNTSDGNLESSALIQFLKNKTHVIISLETLDHTMLDQLPTLRVVSKYGVGLDNLDLTSLRERGIQIGWQGGVNKRSVSELTLGLMLSALRHVPRLNDFAKKEIWKRDTGRLLSGKAVGIVGLGHIGKDLIELLRPFECQILGFDLRPDTDFLKKNGVIYCSSVQELLSKSDVVTLHVPYYGKTKHLLNEERLLSMKHGAVLINTARGGLVDEDALFSVMTSGHITSAAFDVFEQEPPKNSKLFQLENFIATPHIAGNAEEAILNMGRAAIQGLISPRTVDSIFEELYWMENGI